MPGIWKKLRRRWPERWQKDYERKMKLVSSVEKIENNETKEKKNKSPLRRGAAIIILAFLWPLKKMMIRILSKLF